MSKRKKLDTPDNMAMVRAVALGITSTYKAVQLCADDKRTALVIFMAGMSLACSQMLGPDRAALCAHLEKTKDLK